MAFLRGFGIIIQESCARTRQGKGVRASARRPSDSQGFDLYRTMRGGLRLPAAWCPSIGERSETKGLGSFGFICPSGFTGRGS